VHRLTPLWVYSLVGAATLSLGCGAGHAQQAPDRPPSFLRTGFDDLPPTGNRRFVRSRPQRQGARRERTYGNPPGFGAGKTGFVSTNLPPAVAAPTQGGVADRSTDPAATPLPPVVRERRPPDLAAAPEARTANGRPATPRPGAPIAPVVSDWTNTAGIWPVEDDPFAPTGIRAGSFVLHSAVDAGGGYDSNPSRFSGGHGSWFYRVAPEFEARSNWSRHELAVALRGSYIGYESVPSANQPTVDTRLTGRLDFSRNTWMDVEGRYLVATNNPNSPDLPAGLSRLPLYQTLGTTVGLHQRLNRLEFTVKGTFDRITYEDSHLTNGATDSNRDRNYDQYGAVGRVAYELTPGLKPFAEAAFDQRVHDLSVDRFGLRRNSEGLTGRAGTTFEFSRKLTGEISVGYLTRTYKDPTLPDLNGLIFDGSIVWSASGLTTVKLTGTSTADESTLPGVSGVLRRDAALQIDHAFRRWLLGSAKLGYGVDLYRGSTRDDQRYLASLGLTYKFNRDLQMKAEVRREWLRSNNPGSSYDANIAMLSVRVAR
jgi:hypothetical protein